MPAGYSGTPLVKKLGIKPGFKICLLNQPENYQDTLGNLSKDVRILSKPEGKIDFIQYFTKSRLDLEAQFSKLKSLIDMNGMLWISWPKKASKIATDVDENAIREIGLQNGLVDIKVCAVDETWSGLKFVHRLKNRK